MIAVDLFDALDLEVQSARSNAIPDFFAAGAIHSGGSNSRGIVESCELELISGSTVQRTPEITVFRASDGSCIGDSQCGVGRCVASGSVGTCLCDAADYATLDCSLHWTSGTRIPAGSEGVWFAFHTDANNPPQTYAGVSLRYEMVWECPRGVRPGAIGRMCRPWRRRVFGQRGLLAWRVQLYVWQRDRVRCAW